jgi:hypothetical protein
MHIVSIISAPPKILKNKFKERMKKIVFGTLAYLLLLSSGCRRDNLFDRIVKTYQVKTDSTKILGDGTRFFNFHDNQLYCFCSA